MKLKRKKDLKGKLRFQTQRQIEYSWFTKMYYRNEKIERVRGKWDIDSAAVQNTWKLVHFIKRMHKIYN